MPTYAVLGATGNTGTAIIRNLLAQPDSTMNAFCRDSAKLHRLLPETSSNPRVKIYTGSITDESTITDCIRNTSAVFLTISTNTNVPGYHVGQDLAATAIRCCQALQKELKPGQKIPKLILLSSGSCSERLEKDTPWLVKAIIHRAAYHVYADLAATERLLRAEEDWLTSVYIKPGALSVGEARGHRLSLEEYGQVTSYDDLAAGMVDVAEDGDGRWDQKDVGVVATNGAPFPSGTPLTLLCGVLRYYFPFLHPYLPTGGPA